jgi:hypothetical protein
MHPLLVLLAFTLAALVTYVLVLGLLTALSIPRHDADGETAPDPAPGGERVRC